MNVTYLGPLAEKGARLPLYSFRVPAGFPSPAADHIEKHISLDELLNIRAPHVHVVRFGCDAMKAVGIYHGDLGIVDRSITPDHGHLVFGVINGEPSCQRLHLKDGEAKLISENEQITVRHLHEGDELTDWGVVTYSVRGHGPGAAKAGSFMLYSPEDVATFWAPVAHLIPSHMSLDDLLEIRAPSVYLMHVGGDSMKGAGIFHGDIVVIDRMLEAVHDSVVIAAVNGDPICKRLYLRGDDVILVSENPRYPPRYLMPGDDFSIWGVVTFSVRCHDKA